MIHYLLPHPTAENTDTEQNRIRMEQRLNSLSAKSLENLFSKPELRSGLIKHMLKRPEHKLRDLARIALGQSEEALGELNIDQVARLFFERHMTFTFEQLANIAFRRVREYAVARLLSNYSHGTEDKASRLFLVHDESGNVSLVTMENKGDFFPCVVQPIREGPLFDDKMMACILRHPNPNLLWRVTSPVGTQLEKYAISTDPTTGTHRLEGKEKIDWFFSWTPRDYRSKANLEAFREKLKAAYEMPNLEVKVGFGIYWPNYDEGKDERTLFGFPKNGPKLSDEALETERWMAEITGMMAQTSDGGDIPQPMDLANISVQHSKIEWARASGLTFSIRETALFMRNAPRRQGDADKHALLVHDDNRNVFCVEIGYREKRLAFVGISRADMLGSLTSWASNVLFCLPTRCMDGVLLIHPPALVDSRGNYEIPRE